MAIFQDTRELPRHLEPAPGMTKVKGWKKNALAVMGYKDTGERNAWGKAKSFLPNIGVASNLIGRNVAKKLTKGTDANTVMKETDDEWMSAGLSKGKFLYEVAKLGLTLGVGGGIGAAKKAGSSMIEGGGIGGGRDIATSTAGSNLTKMLDSEGTDLAKQTLDLGADNILGNKSNSELINSIGNDENDDGTLNMDKYKERGFSFNELNNEDKKLMKKAKRQKRLGQASNLLDKIPLAGGVASSGLELVAAQKNYTQAAEDEVEKLENQKLAQSRFNLL